MKFITISNLDNTTYVIFIDKITFILDNRRENFRSIKTTDGESIGTRMHMEELIKLIRSA